MFYLIGEHLLDINESIYQKSLVNNDIEYSGWDDYKINIHKINSLVKNVPDGTPIEAATYYLKNLVLLQAFPNANHRTALLAVEYFLLENGINFEYTESEALIFHRESYSIQSKVYHTYEAMDIHILTEARNEFHDHCMEFIEKHSTEGN